MAVPGGRGRGRGRGEGGPPVRGTVGAPAPLVLWVEVPADVQRGRGGGRGGVTEIQYWQYNIHFCTGR